MIVALKLKSNTPNWTVRNLLYATAGRTRQLKLAHFTTASDVMFVLVDFTQSRAVLGVFKVLFPMELGAMRRPTTVRTVKLNRSALFVMIKTHRARRMFKHSRSPTLERRNRRLGQWMEQVVRSEHRRRFGLWRCRWCFLCPSEELACWWAGKGEASRTASELRKTEHLGQEAGHVQGSVLG